jgi:single-stranded DNA-binding protein
MTLRLLATGTLIADPQRREGAKAGQFATASIRVDGDEAVFISVIAFNAEAERLLECARGDAISVAGRARLKSWPGRDGTERTGISVTAEQIAALKPRPKSAVPRRASVGRGLYPPPRPHRRDAAELPADRVDDPLPSSQCHDELDFYLRNVFIGGWPVRFAAPPAVDRACYGNDPGHCIFAPFLPADQARIRFPSAGPVEPAATMRQGRPRSGATMFLWLARFDNCVCDALRRERLNGLEPVL